MFLKQSTAYTFRMGPFLDETDGKTAETGLTISQADVRLSKGGGNFAQKNESSASSHDEIGYYIVVLNTTDTATVGELLVAVHESGALPVFKTFQVVEEAIYDAIYGGSADLITKVDAIDTVVDAILVDTAVIGSAGAGLTAVPWNAAWDAEVQSEVADGLAAYDSPTKAELDSAFTEIKGGSWASTDTLEAIRDRGDAAWTTGGGGSAPTAAAVADAVWDEATSGHTTSGTFGEQVKTDIDAILVDTGTTLDGKIDTIDGIVDSILVDTGTTLNDKIDVIDGIVDSILVDTGTTLDGKLDTIDNFLDTEVAAILADTNELQGDWANGGRLDLLLDATLADTAELQGDWANGGRLDLLIDAILVDTGTTLDGKLDTIDNFLDTEIAAILADTNELQGDWANGGRLDLLLDSVISKVDVVDGIVDSILVDTGTTLDGKLNTIDGIVDAILVDTAVIGSAGAGLSGIPWNSSWDAEVQSEVADALAAYDPPTKAEMDAMWTTAATESYASDGAAATPAQLMYMILCAVSEFSISSTTITGKKLDGSTTAMTWTLNDASSPTSRTRAS